MEKEINSWHSPALNKNMEIVSYGHFGFALLLLPTAAADYLEYRVKSGDTLWSIAKQFPGVSPDNIMTWNNIDENIQAGQKLKILKSEITLP